MLYYITLHRAVFKYGGTAELTLPQKRIAKQTHRPVVFEHFRNPWSIPTDDMLGFFPYANGLPFLHIWSQPQDQQLNNRGQKNP